MEVIKGTKPGGERKRPELTKEEIRLLFRYENGKLFWLPKEGEDRHVKRRNTMFADKEAGFKHKTKGYWIVKVNSTSEQLHRLIFLFHKGFLPAVVDHINGNIDDNRIENLREADQQKNSRNSKRRSTNTSGVKGVHWHKRDCKWVAQLRYGGKLHSLGYFSSIDEAAAEVAKVRASNHGEFCNHG